MNERQSENTIDQYIIEVVTTKNPKTVKDLVKSVQQKYPIPEKEILECILHLQNHGRIALKKDQAPVTPVIKSFIFSKQANWYWTVIAICVATAALVFAIPEKVYPLAYTRYVFGLIFVLYLPGYSLIKALFPTKELDNIERAALSIGMSLILVPVTGLLLNYTPWGIRATQVILSLLALTTLFATAALIREHQIKLKE